VHLDWIEDEPKLASPERDAPLRMVRPISRQGLLLRGFTEESEPRPLGPHPHPVPLPQGAVRRLELTYSVRNPLPLAV